MQNLSKKQPSNFENFNKKTVTFNKVSADSLPNSFKKKFNEVGKRINNGEFIEALTLIKKLEKKHPQNSYLLTLKGIALQNTKQLDEAIKVFNKVIKIQPKLASNHSNLGLSIEKSGNVDVAISHYKKAIYLDPKFANAYYNLACALSTKKEYENAIESFKKCLEINPQSELALDGLGKALYELSHFNEALKCFTLASKISPKFYQTRENLALTLKSLNKREECEIMLRGLVEEVPNQTSAKFHLAQLYNENKKYECAIELLEDLLPQEQQNLHINYELALSYRNVGRLREAKLLIDNILKLDPKNLAAINLDAICSAEGGDQYAYANKLHAALEKSPENPEILNNLAMYYFDEGDLEKAADLYLKAYVNSKKDLQDLTTRLAITGMYYSAIKMCDWARVAVLENKFKDFGVNEEPPTPFILLQFDDNPRHQFIRAKNYTRSSKLINRFSKNDFVENSESSKIKIGYFGADFHNHATMYLMLGMLKNHDRSKFKIFIFSYGKNKDGEVRQRLQNYVDGFYDVQSKTDSEILYLSRELNLDIAIDLKGYTRETRSEIFSNYLAPVQINYLGYPNTMGADHIQYIVADNIVIPQEYREFYTEKVIYLPNSYQPNDDKRQISSMGMSRESLGINDDAFVFCCLNASYKISRREFNIWMRLLEKVEGSVLMLLSSSKITNKNLLIEAEKRGIDENRIIFVGYLPHDQHLERMGLADLFLDTFYVNAHTTASDALWAGVPVVTKIGKQFAARVAASLLFAMDLKELVVETEIEYEELILKLARDKSFLKTIKNKLAKNRESAPLFDTELYTKNFEKGLVTAHQLYLAGKSPIDINVEF